MIRRNIFGMLFISLLFGFQMLHGVDTTPPLPPSNVLSVDETNTTMTLNWTDNSSNEQHFKIYRVYAIGDPTYIDTVAGNTIEYTVTGLIPNNPYMFSVSASNNYGESSKTEMPSYVSPTHTWYGALQTCVNGALSEAADHIPTRTELEGLNEFTCSTKQLTDIEPVRDLKYLTLLNLYGNLITSIPTWITRLNDLENLNLGNNQLSGNIPTELGNIANLTTLRLSINQLSGSIPTELGNLSNLTSLYLYSNQLSGSIPAEFGNLSNLTSLSLYSNQLSGSIPAELGNLSNLTSLSLSENQLSGSIPAELGNFSNLTSLYLYSNQLSGSIPAELGSLYLLKNLHLNHNELTGTIPAEFKDFYWLETLKLNHNKLTGTIPIHLNDLVNLTDSTGMDLTNNCSLISDITVVQDFIDNKSSDYGGYQGILDTNGNCLVPVKAVNIPVLIYLLD